MYANVMNELERIGRKDLYNDILKYESEQAEKLKYNGWSNYSTWCVNLWIDNDEGLNGLVTEWAIDEVTSPVDDKDTMIWALSKKIKSEVEELTPELSGMFSDLLGSALSDVDYYEIAEHYIDDNWSEKETQIEVYQYLKSDYLVYIEKDDQWYITSPGMLMPEVHVIHKEEHRLLWEGTNNDLDDSDLPSELIANIKKRL